MKRRRSKNPWEHIGGGCLVGGRAEEMTHPCDDDFEDQESGEIVNVSTTMRAHLEMPTRYGGTVDSLSGVTRRPGVGPASLRRWNGRRARNGPNWADSLVHRYRRELGVPEGNQALPIPYAPDFVRAWGRSSGYLAYGSGFYGVVYPTRRPGVVLKLTRDASEAYFVRSAMKMGDHPSGMVRFYDVREMPSEGVEPPGANGWTDIIGRKGVYAIWREDVPDVGFGALAPGRILEQMSESKREDFLDAWGELYDHVALSFLMYVAAGHLLRENLLGGRHGEADRKGVLTARAPTRKAEEFVDRYLGRTPKVPMLPSPFGFREEKKTAQRAANSLALPLLGGAAAVAILGWIRNAIEDGRRRMAAAKQPVNQMVGLVDSQKTPTQAGALALGIARACAEKIAEGPMSTAGEALLFYMDKGIVLADVHANNVGFVVRGAQARAVITDPGHAIFLTDEYDKLAIRDLVTRGNPSLDPRALRRRLTR